MERQRRRKGYCGWCGRRILPKSRGRRARYCCHAHRQRAYEDRRRRTEGSWRSLLNKDLRQADERQWVERVAQRVLVLLEERLPSLPPAPPPPRRRPPLHVVPRPPSPPEVG